MAAMRLTIRARVRLRLPVRYRLALLRMGKARFGRRLTMRTRVTPYTVAGRDPATA